MQETWLAVVTGVERFEGARAPAHVAVRRSSPTAHARARCATAAACRSRRSRRARRTPSTPIGSEPPDRSAGALGDRAGAAARGAGRGRGDARARRRGDRRAAAGAARGRAAARRRGLGRGRGLRGARPLAPATSACCCIAAAPRARRAAADLADAPRPQLRRLAARRVTPRAGARLNAPWPPHTPLTWHRVLGADELPEGRVTTVTAGHLSIALTHVDGHVRRPRQPLPAPGRPARRGVDRERPAALPVARLRLLPADRPVARRVRRRGHDAPRRAARRRDLRRRPRRGAARADRERRHGRDARRVGRAARLRDGRALEPRPRRRDPPPGAGRRRWSTSASATRAPRRSPRRPTASSPASPPPA